LRAALLASVLFLGGCAAMSRSACSGANWSEIGERDGLNGMPPRIVGNATYRDRTAGSESN